MGSESVNVHVSELITYKGDVIHFVLRVRYE